MALRRPTTDARPPCTQRGRWLASHGSSMGPSGSHSAVSQLNRARGPYLQFCRPCNYESTAVKPAARPCHIPPYPRGRTFHRKRPNADATGGYAHVSLMSRGRLGSRHRPAQFHLHHGSGPMRSRARRKGPRRVGRVRNTKFSIITRVPGTYPILLIVPKQRTYAAAAVSPYLLVFAGYGNRSRFISA